MSIYDELFGDFVLAPQDKYEVLESDSEFKLNLEIPGASKETIDLEVSDGILKIKVSKTKFETNAFKSLFSLRTFGDSTFRFQLGKNLDSENIKARYENGVLEISLPKKESVITKKIVVS